MRHYRTLVQDLYGKRTSYEDEPGTRHPRVARELVEGSPLRSGMKVLDVATGTGLVARYAGEIVGQAGAVLGIDISETMLAQAHVHLAQSGLGNVTYRRADVMDPSLQETAFDGVFCCEAMVLFEDPVAVLQRWRRLIKAKGFIAFTCTTEESYTAPLLERAWASVAQTVSPRNMHWPLGTEDRIRQALDQAYFTTVGIRKEIAGGVETRKA